MKGLTAIASCGCKKWVVTPTLAKMNWFREYVIAFGAKCKVQRHFKTAGGTTQGSWRGNRNKKILLEQICLILIFKF